MKEWKVLIDKIYEELEAEKNAGHKATTTAINYTHFTGKLFGILEAAKAFLPVEDYIELVTYRSDDREEYFDYFQNNYIEPIYKKGE